MSRRVWSAVAAFAVLALAGCGSNSAGSSADMAAVAPAPAQDNAQTGGTPQQQEAAAKGEADAKGQPAGTSVLQERQLVRAATVELRAPDVDEVTTRVKDLVMAEGGYSAQENSQLNRASVTFNVPGDRLDRVMRAVGGLEGVEVSRRELKTEDVTEQIVDVEARIANQRASVERVRGLLDRATTTAEITSIEAELTKRQSELESAQRRYEKLKGQVALSTLTVVVLANGQPMAAPAEEENGFLTAFAGGWDALLAAFGWLLVVLGGVLPFVVVLGLPAFGYLWWRRRRRAVAASSGTS